MISVRILVIYSSLSINGRFKTVLFENLSDQDSLNVSLQYIIVAFNQKKVELRSCKAEAHQSTRGFMLNVSAEAPERRYQLI